MICEEVIELMQRHLDDDLGAEESKHLKSHIRECEQCKGMFERLQRISLELEKLPKVAPAFSLVDAIIPRLEQIDMLTMGTKSSESEMGSNSEMNGRARASIKEKLRGRFSYKIAGGVVAAGIAFA